MLNITIRPFGDVTFQKDGCLTIIQLTAWGGNVYYFNHFVCEFIAKNKVERDCLSEAYEIEDEVQAELATSLAFMAAQRQAFPNSEIALVEISNMEVVR